MPPGNALYSKPRSSTSCARPAAKIWRKVAGSLPQRCHHGLHTCERATAPNIQIVLVVPSTEGLFRQSVVALQPPAVSPGRTGALPLRRQRPGRLTEQPEAQPIRPLQAGSDRLLRTPIPHPEQHAAAPARWRSSPLRALPGKAPAPCLRAILPVLRRSVFRSLLAP